ncbi:hypothetical protein [Paracoccus shandongensis]|uniref:hypothetical protein n=1 Tax=Paracoccus shandongensis TaxID=2816048 RepID=UPI001A8BF755|nr:hypothetical protein [Paracoccus shandongensis]
MNNPAARTQVVALEQGEPEQSALVNPEPAPQSQLMSVNPAAGELIREAMTANAQEDRVAQLDIPESVTNGQVINSIRILEQPETGHVSVSPESGITLVMTEAERGWNKVSFAYEVTLADKSVVRVDANIDLTPAQQGNGWGLGDGYMLETDARGKLVLEHGENHRKVYVSEGQHALTMEDIATMEGTTVAEIGKTYGGWGAWLAKNPEYGATQDMALTTELGMALWNNTTAFKTTSNWLLFERGYEYPAAARLVARGSNGESELHPQVIGAYGEGDDPVIGGMMNAFQNTSSHTVVTGLNLAGGAQALQGINMLIDNVSIGGMGGNFQNIDGLTIRNSDIVDIIRDAPVNGAETWSPHINRAAGIYISGSEGVLLDGNLFDHNAWVEGYDWSLAATSPMPPSMYSHNLYMQADNLDVTLRDNIFLRGASFGAQVRSGGFIEDNAFIDNNAALNFMGGNYEGKGHVGNYTLLLDNLVTSAGHKRVSQAEGALSMGIDDGGKQSSLIGNIVAHLADPANAAEIAAKGVTHFALNLNASAFFNDTIIYRWQSPKATSNPNQGVEGLEPAVLNATTIQQFTSELLGKEGATIADLANFLRVQAHGELDVVADADLIIAFFREGFGLDMAARTGAETLVFTPDERGDGVRWDNRLNWSTEDLPGTREGDSVDLAGNAVRFGNYTVTVDDFDFGDFGKLAATSGKLTIDGNVSVGDKGASLSIDRAGQVWIDGYHDNDLLDIELAGGRFANTGAFEGETRISLSQNAQLLLATAGGQFYLTDGSSLTITGSKAKAGFDGSDGKSATLKMHNEATLSFIADANGLGKIAEFHSGAFETSYVSSGVRLDGTLAVDLSALDKKAEGVWTLVDADQMIGSFDDIAITGLGTSRDALIRYDYTQDEVVLLVSEAGKGTGQIRSITTGDANFIKHTQDAALKALWTELQPDLNIVVGTIGRDRLEGTDDNDVLIGSGGNMDQLTGGDGADTFFFGLEALDGVRIRTTIMDYEVGIDSIALAKDVRIASLQQAGNTVVAYLDDPAGRDDAIYIRGSDLTVTNITFENDYLLVGA